MPRDQYKTCSGLPIGTYALAPTPKESYATPVEEREGVSIPFFFNVNLFGNSDYCRRSSSFAIELRRLNLYLSGNIFTWLCL